MPIRQRALPAAAVAITGDPMMGTRLIIFSFHFQPNTSFCFDRCTVYAEEQLLLLGLIAELASDTRSSVVSVSVYPSVCLSVTRRNSDKTAKNSITTITPPVKNILVTLKY